MRKPKAQHPAEIAAEQAMIEAIRSADHFLASVFVGVGKYEKQKGTTLADAMRRGNEFVAVNRVNARPIFYAVGADGRATMITNALIERLKGMARK